MDGPVNWTDAKSVAGSVWFEKYHDKVKAAIVKAVTQGRDGFDESPRVGAGSDDESYNRPMKYIEVVTIEGGPVSQLEVRTLPGIISRTVAELKSTGNVCATRSHYRHTLPRALRPRRTNQPSAGLRGVLPQHQDVGVLGSGAEITVFMRPMAYDEFVTRFDEFWLSTVMAKKEFRQVIKHGLLNANQNSYSPDKVQSAQTRLWTILGG